MPLQAHRLLLPWVLVRGARHAGLVLAVVGVNAVDALLVLLSRPIKMPIKLLHWVWSWCKNGRREDGTHVAENHVALLKKATVLCGLAQDAPGKTHMPLVLLVCVCALVMEPGTGETQ